MSYEPTIIIDKKDLEKSRKVIEELFYTQDITHKWWMPNELLHAVLEYAVVDFKKVKMVIINVELTSRNQKFRDYLDKLKIPYALWH